MEHTSQCVRCGLPRKDSLCHNPEGLAPGFCPTKNCGDLIARAEEMYQEEKTRRFAAEAARQAASAKIKDPESGVSITVKPRIQEVIEFCGRMNYHHLGVAFCNALRPEGKLLCGLLEKHGFQVTSVMCKAGGLDRSCVGICGEEKQPPLCNPIGQALIMNEAGTEFNILLGLCVGHDSLFLKHSEAMCTVFAVKDRVTGHNPLAALYTLDTLYNRIKGN